MIQQVNGTNVPLDELDVQQMFDIVQVFQTGTVVKFVEYDDLQVTNVSLVNQLQHRTSGLPSPVFLSCNIPYMLGISSRVST